MATQERELRPTEEAAAERLEALYRSHYAQLVGFCRAFVRDLPTAEDVAQESFLRAYRYLDSFHASRPAWPWLKAIARNVIAARSRRKLQESPLEKIDAPSMPADQEDTIAIRQAWARLAPRHRIALHLRYVEGWDAERSASLLGIEANAFNQLVFRARGRLRGELERLTEVVPGIAVAPVAWMRDRIQTLLARFSRSICEIAARASESMLQVLGGLAVALLATGLVVAGGQQRAEARPKRGLDAPEASAMAPAGQAKNDRAPSPRIAPSDDPSGQRVPVAGGRDRTLVETVSHAAEDAPRHAGPDFRLVPAAGTRDIVRTPKLDGCSIEQTCQPALPAGSPPVLRKVGG